MTPRLAAGHVRQFAAVALTLGVLLMIVSGCSSPADSEREAAQFSGAKEQYEKGQFAKSEEMLLQLLDRSPENREALRTLALAQAAQGKNEEAITQYATLVKLDPKDHASWYRMALLERVLGKADTSAEHLAKALAADPGNRSYTDELARTKMSVGDYEGAAKLWGSLLKGSDVTDESKKELLMLQGQAYQDAKDYKSALAAYKKALKLDPKDKALAERVKSFE